MLLLNNCSIRLQLCAVCTVRMHEFGIPGQAAVQCCVPYVRVHVHYRDYNSTLHLYEDKYLTNPDKTYRVEVINLYGREAVRAGISKNSSALQPVLFKEKSEAPIIDLLSIHRFYSMRRILCVRHNITSVF